VSCGVCCSDQTTSSAAATGVTDTVSGDSDPSRSWAWHQPAGAQSDGTAAGGGGPPGGGVVVYQLPAATSDAVATTSSSDGQPTCYYSVDAYGQLVQQDSASHTTAASASASAATSSLRESQLELEVLHLQTALDEKSREVESLRAQLADACATVERLKCETNSESTSSPATTVLPVASLSTPSDVVCASGDQSSASDSVLAASVPAAPSPAS